MKGEGQQMSKRKIGGVMASAIMAGALVCGSIFASGNQVMVGGSKQGKALWTDYSGMSKEVQGPVDALLFTQSPRTAKGSPSAARASIHCSRRGSCARSF